MIPNYNNIHNCKYNHIHIINNNPNYNHSSNDSGNLMAPDGLPPNAQKCKSL